MDVTSIRFDVGGEMDHRRYDLTIGVSEKPAVFEQAGARDAFYLNQVECFLFEPEDEDDDSGYAIMVTIHQRINPQYDLAVRQLIGDELADQIQDRAEMDCTSEYEELKLTREDVSPEMMIAAYLDNRMDEAKASKIINRVLLNSTFL